MDYISVKQAALNWELTVRTVQIYCKNQMIPGVIRFENAWMIPKDAVRPGQKNGYKKKNNNKPRLCLYLTNERPMNINDANAILKNKYNEAEKNQILGELSYLKGRYKESIDYISNIKDGEHICIPSFFMLVLNSIALGNYDEYCKILKSIERFKIKNYSNNEKLIKTEDITALELLVTAHVAITTFDLKSVPKLIKTGEFLKVPAKFRKAALFQYIRFLHYSEKNNTTISLGKAYIAMYSEEDSFFFTDIYIRLICASALQRLGKRDEAKQWIKDAMKMAIPNGMIGPFAEMLIYLGGLVEECIQHEYPDFYRNVINLYNSFNENILNFYNAYHGTNLILYLTAKEYYVAKMLIRNKSYKEIAAELALSTGRVNNIVSSIYSKLNIHKKEDLEEYIF